MDIYKPTIDYLFTFSVFDSWPELGSVLRRVASKRPRDWQLPIIACEALGASAEKAIPASAALACAQISIILVDDILDEDPRGEYHRIGRGRAGNLALAFQAAGVDALLGSQTGPHIKLEALTSLNLMMLKTAYGQDLDIQNPADETSYWRAVENKSAPFFGCALQLGALFAEASPSIAREMERLGKLYGEMIQIHDDLNDTMAVPANADWLQRRKPLPILFAQTVEHPDHTRFQELYQNISAETALQEAQDILIRCGAVSYCLDQLLRRHQAAQGLLNKMPLQNKGTAGSLIEAVIAPVWKLLEALGLPPEIPTTAVRPLNQV